MPVTLLPAPLPDPKYYLHLCVCRVSINSEIKPHLAFDFLFLFMPQKMVNITLHCASDTGIEGRM